MRRRYEGKLTIVSVPQVVLKLQPHGGKEPKEVTLKREKIKINPVTSLLCGGKASNGSSASSAISSSAESPSKGDAPAPAADSAGKIGYIRVSTFSKQTPENARAALQKLKAEGADR